MEELVEHDCINSAKVENNKKMIKNSKYLFMAKAFALHTF